MESTGQKIKSDYCVFERKGEKALVIESIKNFIPYEEFQRIFNTVKELYVEKRFEKLIFDKRSLSVFDQPSMEWYYLEWKPKMADMGLKKHVKILPDDPLFTKSVRIGREKIAKANPEARYHSLFIEYAGDVEEALNL